LVLGGGIFYALKVEICEEACGGCDQEDGFQVSASVELTVISYDQWSCECHEVAGLSGVIKIWEKDILTNFHIKVKLGPELATLGKFFLV
jgi:hypothetical protein